MTTGKRETLFLRELTLFKAVLAHPRGGSTDVGRAAMFFVFGAIEKAPLRINAVSLT